MLKKTMRHGLLFIEERHMLRVNQILLQLGEVNVLSYQAGDLSLRRVSAIVLR